MAWTKPASWTEKNGLYVTPEGIILRPIATIQEARHFNGMAVLTTDNTLHIAVGRDFAEYDVKHNGSISAIYVDMVKPHGYALVVGGTEYQETPPYSSSAPMSTNIPATTLTNTPNLTQSRADVRVTARRRWRQHQQQMPRTAKALFAVLTNALAGSGFISYGSFVYGTSDGASVASYNNMFGFAWTGGLTTVHKIFLNMTFEKLIDQIANHIENKDKSEVQEKTLAAAQKVKARLGDYAKSPAFLLVTHFCGAANQTAFKSGIVKPVAARYSSKPFGNPGGTIPLMITDYFGSMERTVDGRLATIGSIDLIAGDSAFGQDKPYKIVAREGQITDGSYGLQIPGAIHDRTQAQLNTTSAYYSGASAFKVSRAPEVLELGSTVGGISTARIFGAIGKGYVTNGTTVAAATAPADTPYADIVNWVFDYGGTDPISRTGTSTDEAYYTQLGSINPSPFQQFPLLPSLSHGLDAVSIIDMYRMALKDEPPTWEQLAPYIMLYGRRELSTYGVSITV